MPDNHRDIAQTGSEQRLRRHRPVFVGLICLMWGTDAVADMSCNTPFAEFVAKFQGQPAVQPALTAQPLPMARFTSMGPAMPRRDVTDVAHAELDWPVVPSTKALAARGLAVRLQDIDAQTAELQAESDDHETLLIWRFSKMPCWQLVAFTDATIYP